MKNSFQQIAMIATLLASSAVVAQTPDIEITVRTSPGGKGRVVGFDKKAKEILVELSLPNGKTTTVSASRSHVAPVAWRTLTNLLTTQDIADETNVADSVSPDAGVAAAGRMHRPIEVRTTFGDRGLLLGFDADSNNARVEFQGRTGRPLPIKQLDTDSWRSAKRQLARQLQSENR